MHRAISLAAATTVGLAALLYSAPVHAQRATPAPVLPWAVEAEPEPDAPAGGLSTGEGFAIAAGVLVGLDLLVLGVGLSLWSASGCMDHEICDREVGSAGSSMVLGAALVWLIPALIAGGVAWLTSGRNSESAAREDPTVVRF